MEIECLRFVLIFLLFFFGRKRVCSHYKTIKVPEVHQEVYNKPIAKQYSEPCHGQQICTGVRVVHEKAYRDVVRHRLSKQVVYYCCPGWEKMNESSQDCTKAVCKFSCKNGGTCTKPNTCTCLPGFTGKYCEIDVNECKEEKPCDQFCHNTEGSYYCTCREGFMLHSDRQSCKKIGKKFALKRFFLDPNFTLYCPHNFRR